MINVEHSRTCGCFIRDWIGDEGNGASARRLLIAARRPSSVELLQRLRPGMLGIGGAVALLCSSANIANAQYVDVNSVAGAAAATGAESIAVGGDSEASGVAGIAIGYEAEANGNFTTSIGRRAIANSASTAIGFGANATGTLSTAVGSLSSGGGDASVGVGMGAAIGQGSTALGGGWVGTGPVPAAFTVNPAGDSYEAYGRDIVYVVDPTAPAGTTRIVGTIDGKSFEMDFDDAASPISNAYDGVTGGSFDGQTLSQEEAAGLFTSLFLGNPLAVGVGSIATGAGSSAIADYSIAQGYRAYADVEGGVALGSNSVASTAAGVAGYAPTGASTTQLAAIAATQSTLGAFSVGDAGNGQFRQITGVAAGTEDSDAVNVSQLRALDDIAVKYDLDGAGNRANSVTLLGGDPNAPVLIRNVAAGVAPTDAVNLDQLNDGLATTLNTANTYTDNVAVTTLNQANNYTDFKFGQLNKDIGEVRGEARQAAAIGLAAASLRFDDRPGKLSVAAGGGAWRGEGAFALGAGYTSETGVRANVTGTTAGGHWGVGGGLSFTLN